MSLCALGMAEEFARRRHRVQRAVAAHADRHRRGAEPARRRRGDGRARASPRSYADAAYAILTRPSRECTGNTFLCEDVLAEEGVTDFDAVRLRRRRRRRRSTCSSTTPEQGSAHRPEFTAGGNERGGQVLEHVAQRDRRVRLVGDDGPGEHGEREAREVIGGRARGVEVKHDLHLPTRRTLDGELAYAFHDALDLAPAGPGGLRGHDDQDAREFRMALDRRGGAIEQRPDAVELRAGAPVGDPGQPDELLAPRSMAARTTPCLEPK